MRVSLCPQPSRSDGVAAIAEHPHARDAAATHRDGAVAALVDPCSALNPGRPLVDCNEHLVPGGVTYLLDVELPFPP